MTWGLSNPDHLDHPVGQRADPLPRGDDARQVEGIRCRHDHRRCPNPLLIPSHHPQRVERLGKRELLAQETFDKTTAPDLTPRLYPAQRREQIPPRRRQRLSRNNVPEHHSPSSQKLAGECLNVGGSSVAVRVVVVWRSEGRMQQGPPTCGMSGTGGPVAPFAAPALRIDQRAQVVEAVGRDDPGGY